MVTQEAFLVGSGTLRTQIKKHKEAFGCCLFCRFLSTLAMNVPHPSLSLFILCALFDKGTHKILLHFRAIFMGGSKAYVSPCVFASLQNRCSAAGKVPRTVLQLGAKYSPHLLRPASDAQSLANSRVASTFHLIELPPPSSPRTTSPPAHLHWSPPPSNHLSSRPRHTYCREIQTVMIRTAVSPYSYTRTSTRMATSRQCCQ